MHNIIHFVHQDFHKSLICERIEKKAITVLDDEDRVIKGDINTLK
jgi:hypothetical protein